MSNTGRSPAPVASAPPDASSGESRRGVWIAVAVAGLWVLTLAALAFFTANPVTLNVEQIRRADYVVTGRVSEESADRLVVEREWKGTDIPELVRVENLSQTAIKPGRSYLVPLSRARADLLEVTTTDLPESPPLVYPATEDATRQLSAILPLSAPDQSSSASVSLPDR